YSEMSIGDGVGLIMREARVEFKAEAFWGDRLKIYLRIASLEAAAFRFDYLIVRSDDESRVIATGETEMLGFDYARRKVKRLPLKFIEAIQNYEGSALG
ncbi:MAG: thioesterase family protein, partial [candidate division KSB1 bacterium]|nr:thioesterase family protein [candidate division KSB1 bacterium]